MKALSPEPGTVFVSQFEAVVQLPRYRKDRLPFVATIEACASAVLNRALTDIAALDFHVEPPLAMPILR